jgi:hypothetical protein
MATFQFTTTAEEDAAIIHSTQIFNAGPEKQSAPLTPRQFVELHLRQLLNVWLGRYREAQRATRRELYEKATVEDQTTIDGILDKYRT